MTCGIYCITNTLNGKQYVGQSIHIEQRFNEHCRKCAGLIIDKAIQKYGKSNFNFEILEECPNDFDILNEKEIYWIEKLGTYDDKKHYNLTKGGNNASHRIGNIQSNSTRAKISKKLKGKYSNKTTIQKNGFVNGKQQYRLVYQGKTIARSQDIERLEYIRDYEDWDMLNVPKVTLQKGGHTRGRQKWTIYYKKVELKSTMDLNKAKKFLKLAKSKLEGEDREYYENNLHEVIPCRKYTHKQPSDLNKVEYNKKGYNPNHNDKLDMSKKLNSSGVYRVSIEKDRFRYLYTDVMGKRRSLCSIDPQKLKQKVMSSDLEWIVLDEDKARECGLV